MGTIGGTNCGDTDRDTKGGSCVKRHIALLQVMVMTPDPAHLSSPYSTPVDAFEPGMVAHLLPAVALAWISW